MNFSLLNVLRPSRNVAVMAVAMVATAMTAHASPILVNGGFEQLLKPGVSSEFGDLYPSQQVTGWTTNGFNFVFTPGTADTTGAAYIFGQAYLWGSHNGGASVLTNSPSGGNFLALDGNASVGVVSQTITGLTKGATETISFYFAGAQQQGSGPNFSGSTTEQLKVTLGSQDLYTQVLTNVEHGFTGWNYVSLNFIATGPTETLSFLSIGTPPSGAPPFTLLDGVTLAESSPVPEPGSLALLATGLVSAAGMVRRRFVKA